MADEKPGSPWEMYFLVGGILLALFVLWIARGGPKMDNGGALINPPPPLGNGQTYTPSYIEEATGTQAAPAVSN